VSVDQIVVLVVGGGALALVSLLSVGLVLLRRGQLRHELAAVRAGRYPGTIAYQRYSEASAQRGLVLVLTLLVLALAVAVPVFAGQVGTVLGMDDPFPQQSLGIGLAFVLPLVLLPFWLYLLLAGALADAPAFAQLRGLPTRPQDVLALRLKGILAGLPAALVLEVGLALVAFDVPQWLPPAVLIGGLVVVLVVLTRVRVPLYRWYYRSQPIERTQWAALAPRAAAWGQRIGARVRAVYVREMARYGSGDTLIVGGRRNCVLFLSDTFLGVSEWRQQDAMIALSLSLIAGQRRRTLRLYLSLAALLLAVLFVATLQFLPTLLGDSPDAELLGALLGLVVSLLFLGLFIALLVWSIIDRAKNPTGLKQRFLAADLAAAAVIGDPLAVMAALNTTMALAGISARKRAGAALISGAERMQALDQWTRQPGPRAPWFAEPVPCIVPVQIGPYVLTAPLTPAAKEATPPPVPSGPYPVVMPYPPPAPVSVAVGTPPRPVWPARLAAPPPPAPPLT
jgi:hypothetical protein